MVGVGWGRVGFSLARNLRDLARFLDECPLNIIPCATFVSQFSDLSYHKC